jgi:hypothetical protein
MGPARSAIREALLEYDNELNAGEPLCAQPFFTPMAVRTF